MFTSFRTGFADNITSAGHLAILPLAWYYDVPPMMWVAGLALVSLISFIFWASTLKRNRLIADTPTSKIASAAQGYVELYGPAIRAPEYLAAGGRNSMPCIWYRYVVYHREKDSKGNESWVEVERDVSDSTFAIDDGSGRCIIDPDNAEVITTHSTTTYDGDYKTVEEQLFPSDKIYALGEFATIGGANSQLNQSEDVAALLAEWKKDQPKLLERFDLNKDGQIDVMEWGLARRAAMREVEKQHRELLQQPGVNVMRAPHDGRLFLLSNLSPDQLKNRYVLWGWFHLITFFAAGGAALWQGVRMALW